MITIFGILHFFHVPFPLVTAFFGVLAAVYHSYLLGERLIAGAGRITRALYGSVLLCALIACIQTVWFYASFPLNASSDGWTLIIACIATHVLTLRPQIPFNEDTHTDQTHWTPTRTFLALTLLFLALLCTGYVLYSSALAATTHSIRTPWPLLPTGTFVAIECVWFAAILSMQFIRSRTASVLHAICGIATITAIAPILYRIGFGFDGFLHIAGEQILATTGTLTPHPPYYIGQYAFTTWFARLIDLPGSLAFIDRWLVPVAATLLLPLSLAIGRRSQDSAAFLTFILLPLSAFVATTPQSFAYVLGISAILLARHIGNTGASARAMLIIASWSIAVHPLAGIPFFLIACAVWSVRSQYKNLIVLRSSFASLCIVLSAIAIPIAFILMSASQGTRIDWNQSRLWDWHPWLDAWNSILPTIGKTYTIWPGWASLCMQALPAILILAIIFRALRQQFLKLPHAKDTVVLVAASLCLFIASIGLKTAGDFAFLIEYERGNFADRLQLMSLFCLWIAAIPAIQDFFEQVKTLPPLGRGIAFWIFCAYATGLGYNALPRHDALTIGHGWSVSATDIEAVRAIDRDAAGRPYTVLANQSVSAAAVTTLGFKRYSDDVFFYPIPTGGPLYTLYLEVAAAKNIQDTILDAATLGQSNSVYVVINDYWWQADQVIETLLTHTKAHWSFGDSTKGIGSVVHVFRFDVKK